VVVFLTRKLEVIGHNASREHGESSALRAGPSLNQAIVEITQILEMVLICYKRSEALSVKNQLEWMAARKTTEPEDMSLLGIFEVHISIIYGHDRREANARRLGHQIPYLHCPPFEPRFRRFWCWGFGTNMKRARLELRSWYGRSTSWSVWTGLYCTRNDQGGTRKSLWLCESMLRYQNFNHG
jgi:hypothetical protein